MFNGSHGFLELQSELRSFDLQCLVVCRWPRVRNDESRLRKALLDQLLALLRLRRSSVGRRAASEETEVCFLLRVQRARWSRAGRFRRGRRGCEFRVMVIGLSVSDVACGCRGVWRLSRLSSDSRRLWTVASGVVALRSSSAMVRQYACWRGGRDG
jgi:hypothetical protein